MTLPGKLILLVIVFVPLVWSGVIALATRLGRKGFSDVAEKHVLSIMLAPIAVGSLIAAVAPLLPVNVPIPLLPWIEEGGGAQQATVSQPVQEHTIQFTLTWLPQAMLVLYCVIALARIFALICGELRLRGAVRVGKREMALGEEVVVTPSAVPPVTWRQVILLPQSLVAILSPQQAALIVDHEREHLRRGDPTWFTVLAWIDALVWFNPFVRHQTHRCRMAAELACDAAVTASQPTMRRDYAETLVMALKHAAGVVRSYAPAAFSNAQSGDYRMRIMHILRPSANVRKPLWLLYGLVIALALPAGFAQYAWSQSKEPSSVEPSKTQADLFTVFPVSGRISSGFGPRVHPVSQELAFHSGIDFAIAEGTEIHSVATGRVTYAGERDGYQKTVEVDYGGGRSVRYAQLGTIRVKTGDPVKVDEVVATSGNYGTGPHLHFEVWQDGKPIDPQTTFKEGVPAVISANSAHKNDEGTTFSGDVRVQKGDRTLLADFLFVKP